MTVGRPILAISLTLLLVPAASAKQLTILHTNDLHSHIGPHGPGGRYGGYARVAKLINDIRATTPNVLLLDAGDWIEGSHYFRFNQPTGDQWAGTADLSVMNLMGYDGIVLGNHDYIDYNHTFNNGNPVPTVVERLQRANLTFPILSYNFNSPAMTTLDPYLVDHGDAQPFVIIDVNGIKVAMAGLTEEMFVYTMFLANSVLDDPTGNGGAYVQPAVDAMNAQNPDVTMLLNHIGHGDDQYVAQNTHGVDLIVGGHSHTRLFSVDTQMNNATPPEPVSIVQAGSQGMYLGRLDIDIDDATKVVTVLSYKLIPVDQNVAVDPTVGAKVQTLKDAVIAKSGDVFNDSVATMTIGMSANSREGSVGNLVVDAVLAKASSAPWNASLSWVSNGAVSNPGDIMLDGLRKGNVRSEDVYRLYGHGYNPTADANFRIFLVDYTGDQVMWFQENINFGDNALALGESLFINMAGGEVIYDPQLPNGSRVTSFTVGGAPINLTQTYTLAIGEGELQTIDYLYAGGLVPFNYTNKRMLTDGSGKGVEVWTAIRDFLAANSPVQKADVDLDGRYRTVEQDLGIENYDLGITPASYKVGDTVTINVTVSNFGQTASATGPTLEVYREKTPGDWSDDPSYDNSTLIGTVAVPSIAPFPATQTFTFPWDTTGERPGEIPIYVKLVGLTEENGGNHFAWTYTDGMIVPWRMAAGQGPGPLNAPEVRVLSGLGTPTKTADFAAYGSTGYGVNVSAGNVDALPSDEEILTAPGPGAVYGPQIKAFHLDGTSMGKINFYAYGTLRFGANVAGGSIDPDGYAEIVSGAGPGAVFGPHVRAFNFDGATLYGIAKVSFFATNTLKYGVNVATGDVDGDAMREILTGPGPGAVFGPQVRGFNFDGTTLTSIAKINFNAFGTTGYGARVGAGDLDKDSYAEILAGPGPSNVFAGQLRGFNYDNSTITTMVNVNFFPFPNLKWGVRPGAGDVDADGYDEIVATPGPDPAAEARVRAFNVDTAIGGPTYVDFLAFDPERYGASAAVASLAP